MVATQTRTGPLSQQTGTQTENDAARDGASAEPRKTHVAGQPDVLTVIAELEDELVRGEEMRLAAERRAAETAERAQVTQRQNRKLRGQITAMQQRISVFESQLETARRDQSATVAEETQRARAENDRLRSEVESARERLVELEQAEAKRDKLRKIGAKLRDSLAIRDGQLKAAEADRTRLESALRAAKDATQGSLAETATQRDRLAVRLKTVSGELEHARAAQKTALAKAEASDKRAAALAAELEETAALKRRGENKLAGATMTCGRLKKELANLRETLSQAAAAQSQSRQRAKALESRVETMQAERAELLATLNRTEATACELKVECDRLRESARQTQEMLDATHTAKAAAERTLRKKTHRIAELVANLDEIDATLRRSEADLNGIAAQRDQLRERLESARAELAEAKAARQDAESSAAAKGERLKQLQSIVDDALALQVTSIRDENAAFAGRLRALERNNASLSQQNEKRNAELRSAREAKRRAEANLKQVRTAVSDLTSVLTTTGPQLARTVETEKEASSGPAIAAVSDATTP